MLDTRILSEEARMFYIKLLKDGELEKFRAGYVSIDIDVLCCLEFRIRHSIGPNFFSTATSRQMYKEVNSMKDLLLAFDKTEQIYRLFKNYYDDRIGFKKWPENAD